MEQIRGMVVDRCDLPEGYDVNGYEFLQGTPTRVLEDNASAGAFCGSCTRPVIRRGICVFMKGSGAALSPAIWFTRTPCLPSAGPEAYLKSLERVAALPVRRVFPAHHSLEIGPDILTRMREASCITAAVHSITATGLCGCDLKYVRQASFSGSGLPFSGI